MIRHYFRRTFILSLVFGMTIFLLPFGVFAQTTVSVDIKPGSCPNPMNVKSQGILMVAILGTPAVGDIPAFDVSTIDPASIKMVLPGGTLVAPIRSKIADVATYVEEPPSSECGTCYTQVGDGYPDLTVKFSTQDIVAALEIEAGLEEGEVLTDGECTILTLTGELYDDTLITGTDSVKLLVKGNQYNYRHRHRNLPTE